MDAVGAGRTGDASLGYSLQNWATDWFQAVFSCQLVTQDLAHLER